MHRIALAALAALLLLAPAASAAPKLKPPVCKAGQITVRALVKVAKPAKGKPGKRAKLTCRTLIRPGAAPLPPAAVLGKAAVTPKELQAMLPKRLRTRFPLAMMTRLDRAFTQRRATARAASSARPRAETSGAGCAAAPTPGPTIKTPVDGGTMTSTGSSWGSPGGATWGTQTVIRAELSRDGMTGGRTQTIKQCVHFDSCPSADGIVTGTWEFAHEEVMSASKDGVGGSVRLNVRATAKLTGHVGADGRATTFDWTGEGTGTSRGQATAPGMPTKHKANETVRVTASQGGLDPRNGGKAPAEAKWGAWGVGGSVLDGSKDASVNTAGYTLLALVGQLPHQAAKALLGAETVWYDDAACLDVVFDPQPAQVSDNAKVPVAVKIRAKDGADVPSSYDAQPVVGQVAPSAGTTAATVTWTAPDKVGEGTFATFKVTAVSKRGRALGTHTAKGTEKAKWWRVTSEGAGEYGRHEERGIPYPQLWSEIHFRYRMVSMPVRLPSLNPAVRGLTSSEVAEVAGDANARRVDGGGTSTCASPLDGTSNLGRVAVEGGDGGFYLDVVPFFHLRPVDRTCPFDSMLLWMGANVEPAMRATIHVTPAELETKDRIEKVVSEPGASADCRGARNAGNNDVPCTEQVKWQGRIVLERVPAPAWAQ